MTSTSEKLLLFRDNNTTMATQDPFMTLVDAATALIDEKKRPGEKESLSIVAPKNANKEGASVTRHHVRHSTTPPPPHASASKPATLVSPSTPKSSNRTQVHPTIVGSRGHKQSFARDLMDVLLDPQYSDIITFLPEGDAFAILEPKRFQETVMEQRFGIRTFSPFVRKLHRWGFERIMDKKTHAVDVFRHPLFVRGNYRLCDKIKCIGRLVKGPLEEAILTQAGISNKSIGMPTHQGIEIRNFCERMHNMESTAVVSPPRRQQLQNKDNIMAQAYLLEQAARRQADARRHQREQVEEVLLLEAKLRRQRQAESRQLLQQQQHQMTDSSTVNQILLALQSRSREEELIAQELQKIKEEELLRQQIAQEAKLVQEANALQQAHLEELLGAGNGRSNRTSQQATDDIPVSALLRAALESNSGGSLANQLRQYL